MEAKTTGKRRKLMRFSVGFSVRESKFRVPKLFLNFSEDFRRAVILAYPPAPN